MKKVHTNISVKAMYLVSLRLHCSSSEEVVDTVELFVIIECSVIMNILRSTTIISSGSFLS